MFTVARTVVSGRPYHVVSINGLRPTSIDVLDGPAWFVIDLDGERYAVRGEGAKHGDLVRFHEKCDDGKGKDMRCWSVAAEADGTVTATP